MNPVAVEQHPIEERGASPIGAAIVGRCITKKFGKTLALNGLDINVPTGSVYALLGRNGVGKSTLMQLIMGMLDPTEGTVTVLGYNPTTDDVAVKQRLGYIPERMPMYDWMTVDQILGFVAGMYKNWSYEEEDRLSVQFRLQRQQKVGALSRGNRALLSLVIAMAHQPDLVLLDECTSGMDALARREFERSVINALTGSGRTVLFAGHQIDEMERICDWVGIMHNGRMLVEMPLDDLKQTVVSLRIGGVTEAPTHLPGCTVLTSAISGSDIFATVKLDDFLLPLPPFAAPLILKEILPISLEEMFVSLMTAEDSR
jgi:ABC-2 type transport system ATP-binding protein